MLKYLIFISTFAVSCEVFAVLDFLMKKSEDLVKVSIYGDAIADLLQEVAPDTSLEKSVQNGKNHSSKISQDAQNLYYVGDETRSVLSGPDLGNESLEQNIRSSSDYVRKLKSLSLKAAVLGTDGVTALSTIQTNQTLEQIRKNQATEIALQQQMQTRQVKKSAVEEAKMHNFILEQRAIRKATTRGAR